MITDTRNEDPIIKLFTAMGGIEAQEARGQRKLVRSSDLPKKWGSNGNAADLYKKMGIVVVGPSKSHDIFLEVVLPEGWKKVSTDHSMWSNLLDNKGRKRASIFYKAAFYDCDAFINVERRFSYRVFNYLPEEKRGHYEKERVKVCEAVERRYFSPDGSDVFVYKERPKYETRKKWVSRFESDYIEKNNTPHYIEIYDGDTVIYSSKDKSMFYKRKYRKCIHRKWWNGYERFQRRMIYEAYKYLNARYPGWESVDAYWD